MEKKTLNVIARWVASAAVALVSIVTVSRCGSGTGVTATFTQIERIGRPAINEGLVLYNNELLAFNTLAPSMDLQTSNIIVQAVQAEMSAVLTALNTFSPSGARANDVIGGFLPDVMRIDTTAGIAVNQMAYNGAAVGTDSGAAGSDPVILIGGRKLEDQVINITLAYVFAGTAGSSDGPTFTTAIAQNIGLAFTDRLTYDMGTSCATAGQGSNPQAPGHNCLFGASARYATATFPYLANPY